MWIRNLDTGKWIKQTETLVKENYESLKVDLDRVKLYSKCLSGATYLTLNDFDNLYPQLQQSHKGYYVNLQNFRGPSIKIDNSNQEEFYEKYLKEDGFTVKTLFTPEKLLTDQSENLKFVDVATTESIIINPNTNIVIDGVKLISGHRVLIKDQKTFITLSNIDEDDYFTNVLPVSSYTYSNFEVTTKTYEYFSSENGIYLYDGLNLTKTDELKNYDSAYKLALSVKLGDLNTNKQFHLERLKNGYYPTEGQSVEFKERNSWVLRNRVDYNNIFDLNYYDVKYFQPESVYDNINSKTYSIPERIIAVGEFGIIVNNQDKLSSSATFSVSNIISNKFKVNLRSITNTKNYYWVCGDEGTLLKISKIDFSIEQFDLGEDLNLTSVSFYGDLYGMVVGKFNTIYYTRDGGFKWKKIEYDEFSIYSYNKVLHYNENVVYIVGEGGLFIDMVYSNDVWIGYLRDVTKELSRIDFYPLVEDINDLQLTSFVNIQTSTFSKYFGTSSSFENSLVFKTRLNYQNALEITIDSEIFNQKNDFAWYISVSYSSTNGSSYNNPFFGQQSADPNTANFFYSQNVQEFYLNQNTETGDILPGKINLSFQIAHNYNYLDPFGPLSSFTYSYVDFSVEALKGELLLMAGSNQTVLCYDINNIIDKSGNQFVFMKFDKSSGDNMSISRRIGTLETYLAGSKIYKFSLTDFNNIKDIRTNSAESTLEDVTDLFANKIVAYGDKILLCGNSSLNKISTYDTFFNDLDPTFINRLDSKFLVLDYDIGAKLNFFDDNGQYRLPTKLEIPVSSLTTNNTVLSLSSYEDEVSWLDYYSDSQKTFAYNTHIEDGAAVKFSRNFSYDPYHTPFTMSSVDLGEQAFIYGLDTMAPHFSDKSNSEFIYTNEISNRFLTEYDLLLNKNLAVIKRTYLTKINGRGQSDYNNLSDKTNIGDVLSFSADIVETKLVVNQVRYYTSNSQTGEGVFTQSKPISMATFDKLDTYLYCYTDFNESILNALKRNTSVAKTITVKNLNRYKNEDDLIENFNSHSYGVGYKLSKSNDNINFEALFNDRTSYYNMQCRVSDSRINYDFRYRQSFLDFGFTPQYNILTFLRKINPEIFTPSKDFRILPKYFDLTGNNKGSATDTNIWLDSTKPSNFLRFGKKYFLEWKSLSINTFVDLRASGSSGIFRFTQFLIIEKYYDTETDSYFIKFNKKIDIPIDSGVIIFDIISRNTLEDISKDLQLLNNIHRSYTPHTILWKSGNGTVEKTFTNYESSIKTKFSTESYLKAFVSDYDIRQSISAILYNDRNFEVSMNVLNLEREVSFDIVQLASSGVENNLSFIVLGTQDEFKVGTLVFVEIDDVESPMEGYQTITFVNSNFIRTSREFDFNTNSNSGRVKLIKQDPFFNFQPVDIFRSGVGKSVTRSVELLPKNTELSGDQYSLVNVNLNKFKLELIDGLSLEELSRFHHWILEAEISNALIGKDRDGNIIWYSGTWRCGRWFGGTWHSGRWLSGDWYDGVWNAYSVQNNIISANVDKSFSDQSLSIWYNGRWFNGVWNNGIWYNGRRYSGDWITGTWFNGIWNDGLWQSGSFRGGVWVNGTWLAGLFNCDSKPSYWINGTFRTGDFENGMWYNGIFGNDQGIRTRFGTRANNSRTATWHSGKWIDGEFHSNLNTDANTSLPTVSDIHKFSVWRTGVWTKGNWYGGISYNIDFKSGTWHGGILEEIQVIGIDSIVPSETSKNKIYINGIFKFNPGDEIWIIDDDRGGIFSQLGSNNQPRKYRINQIIEDDENNQTGLFLNYNLSTLGVDENYASNTYSVEFGNNADLGIRVVSHFKDTHWKSGLWTNGIFDGTKFDSGIWFNGLFEGTWGN